MRNKPFQAAVVEPGQIENVCCHTEKRINPCAKPPTQKKPQNNNNNQQTQKEELPDAIVKKNLAMIQS